MKKPVTHTITLPLGHPLEEGDVVQFGKKSFRVLSASCLKSAQDWAQIDIMELTWKEHFCYLFHKWADKVVALTKKLVTRG